VVPIKQNELFAAQNWGTQPLACPFAFENIFQMQSQSLCIFSLSQQGTIESFEGDFLYFSKIQPRSAVLTGDEAGTASTK
jgi:hypothetical protein